MLQNCQLRRSFGGVFCVEGKSGKKRQKTCKKDLTTGDRYDIMTKLSARGTQTKSGSKKPEKSLKNLLTNGNSCDIIYRLPTRGDGEPKRTPKKLKKVLKKPLDKRKRL